MLRPFPHPVACCCAKFETGQTFSYEQTDATTPHIVGPTMLLVVASVCTPLPTRATTPNIVGLTMLGVVASVARSFSS